MTRDVLLAIDAGGSYVKATTFNLTTGESRTVGEPVGLSRSAPGFNERDADALWRATVRCVQGCLQQLAGGASRVAAVGITGHGNGIYLVDDRGLPTRNAIMAADGRAASLVRRWVADGMEDRLRPAAWNGLWAGKPGPILAWLARHEPDVLASSYAVLGCKDYLRARLTGEVRTELSDASAGGLYNNSALINDPHTELRPAAATLDALGLGAHAHLLLPTIDPMTIFAVSAEAALETGLMAGTVVVAGVVDNAAMQHGSGVFDSSAVCVGAGTWSINQLLVPLSDMTMDGALGAVLPSAANAALGGYGLLCEASATSASSFAWALETAVTGASSADRPAGRDVFAAALQREGSRPRRADDPMFFPFIDGSRDEAAARGAWLGLSSASTEGDLLGAVLEGICLEHRRHVDRLDKALATPLPVRLSGGATKSDVWSQRFADILARPVEVSPLSELGSVCVAAMAGTAAGIFDGVEPGVSALSPAWRTFEPNPADAEFNQARWDLYRIWAERLDQEPWGA